MRRFLLLLCLVLAQLLLPPPSRAARSESCFGSTTPTMTLYLPNITKTLGGPTGWVTPFIVQNVGTASTVLEVSFFDFATGSLISCRRLSSLAPGTSFADVPNNDADLPGNAQFSVVVRSYGSPIVAVVNEHQGSGTRAEALSYGGLSAGATTVFLPVVSKARGGWLTTFVIQNVGASTTTVSARFVTYDPRLTVTLSRTIAPGRAQFVDPTVEAALAGGYDYAVTLSADQPIAVVANAHNDAPGVAAPMGFSYNGIPAPSASTTYLPYVARNVGSGGRVTHVIIQNAGSTTAAPTLTLRSFLGMTATVTGPAIAPGASWEYDPRLAADGSLCPAAGGPGCSAEGEHSLVISGGQFAAIAAGLSATAATGYAGASRGGSRVYLPNVTRTLGGSDGWTTPIILQFAGATSVMVSWYRFSDGAFIVGHPFGGLAAGASIRIDPRTLQGLADDTQYAVVVDASGGDVVAIVTELNAQGGDGEMVYEGFTDASLAAPPPAPTPRPTATLAPAATATPTPAANRVPTTLEISPASVTLGYGQTQQFTATVRDQAGQAIPGYGVTWRWSPVSLGSVTSSGLFTAGSTAVTGTLRAEAGVQYPSVYAVANITISAPPLVASCTPPASGVRAYRAAFVPIVPAGASGADQAKLLQLVSGLRDIFPVHWASATECLSSLEVVGPELITDTAGTIITGTRADTAKATEIFYQSHTDTFDFLIFFPLQSYVRYDWSTNKSDGFGYPQSPRFIPAGVNRFFGHAHITITPGGLANQPHNYVPVLLHEIHHQWCCIVKAPPGYGLGEWALTHDVTHWSTWLLFPPKPKYPIIGGDATGWGWTVNADGSYKLDCEAGDTTVAGSYRFPKIGLFLMGLVPSSQVPPLELLSGTGDARDRCISSGAVSVTYTGLTKTVVPISAIVAANSWLQNRP